jgi:hypothetical protein
MMDDKLFLEDASVLSRRMDTDRFGPFVFQPGFTAAAVVLALHRVEDAHARFVASPLSQVANRLQQEVVVSSVFGTNTIEGGTLSEAETARVLQLDPAEVKETEQRRAVNIKAAYDHAQQAARTPGWRLDLDFIRSIHAHITRGPPDPDMVPGVFRDNPKAKTTWVGDAAHGGRYKPPQYGGDVNAAHGQADRMARLPARARGAGTDPRAAGASLLRNDPSLLGRQRPRRPRDRSDAAAGGGLPLRAVRDGAPLPENIDEYFTLFNSCRQAAEKRRDAPNQGFVDFHLEGMRQTINTLHDRVNLLVNRLLYESRIRRALDDKRINARQYTILSMLLDRGRPLPLDEVRRAPWYTSLYLKLNDKTRQRDLHRLRELELAFLTTDNTLWPGFVVPEAIKPPGRQPSP